MYAGVSLDGKNSVITGGTRGIGLALARGFLEAGANVTICGRNQASVDEALAELSGHAQQIHGVAAHVGRREDREHLVAEAEQRFGRVNVLVNNAGTNPYFGPIVESDERAWDKTMQVNLRAPYVLSRMVGAGMLEAGTGSIINVASVAGLEAAPMMGIYSVTKAGLIMLTKVMAREFGRHGVRVNCICPGIIQTELSRGLWDDKQQAKALLARKSLGRFGHPDELVGAGIYFASEASSFTTGAVLQVDGGMVI